MMDEEYFLIPFLEIRKDSGGSGDHPAKEMQCVHSKHSQSPSFSQLFNSTISTASASRYILTKDTVTDDGNERDRRVYGIFEAELEDS